MSTENDFYVPKGDWEMVSEEEFRQNYIEGENVSTRLTNLGAGLAPYLTESSKSLGTGYLLGQFDPALGIVSASALGTYSLGTLDGDLSETVQNGYEKGRSDEPSSNMKMFLARKLGRKSKEAEDRVNRLLEQTF